MSNARKKQKTATRCGCLDTVIIGVTAHNIGHIAHIGAIAPCAIKNPGFKLFNSNIAQVSVISHTVR